jgi:hypothetical protein
MFKLLIFVVITFIVKNITCFNTKYIKCKNLSWFLPDKTNNVNLEKIIFISQHCRDNKLMCSKSSLLYEDSFDKKNINEIKDYFHNFNQDEKEYFNYYINKLAKCNIYKKPSKKQIKKYF